MPDTAAAGCDVEALSLVVAPFRACLVGSSPVGPVVGMAAGSGSGGRAWRRLPLSFGVTVPIAHRWFSEWTQAGLWRRLCRAVLDELGPQGMIDWSRAVINGASVRPKKVPLCRRQASEGGVRGSFRRLAMQVRRRGVLLPRIVACNNG